MERLKDDDLVLIAQKVAEYGTQHLMSFLRTSKDHARISKMPDVLRALPPDHLDLYNSDKITLPQQNFINMIIESGHADYCVLRGVHLMFQPDPNVAEIRRVLEIASAAKVEAANYFLMMLDASAAGGLEIERAISTFTRFFRAQKLGELRLCMVGWRTPYWNHACTLLWSRPMPEGLVLRTLCPSKDTCKGDGRLPGFDWPAPGYDYEYSQTEVCILCRFDTELHGFLTTFKLI